MTNFVLNKKLPYYAIAFCITLCSIMGVWWLYLLTKIGQTLQAVAPSHLPSNNLYKMIIAEGSTFFILLIFVLIIILFLVKNDKAKIFAMQRFYAIFSHELKTPLTTLQLQLEILPAIINNPTIDHPRLEKTLTRLNVASEQLKNEVHKMLTLSQLELGQKIKTDPIDLKKFLLHWIETKKSQSFKFSLTLDENMSYLILGNVQALDTILNNLFNNTERHNANAKTVDLTLSVKNRNFIELIYTDQGQVSTELAKNLGSLFLKSPNSQGSGLGLYIIAQMMKLIKGKADFITPNNTLSTILTFKKE